mmetsp:Transcript_31909/g.43204  ORF Transcript_31909/g.43204 Transcript_31909/m.43204 type:complete len:231 (+) Transcript_31909:305-997(+)
MVLLLVRIWRQRRLPHLWALLRPNMMIAHLIGHHSARLVWRSRALRRRLFSASFDLLLPPLRLRLALFFRVVALSRNPSTFPRRRQQALRTIGSVALPPHHNHPPPQSHTRRPLSFPTPQGGPQYAPSVSVKCSGDSLTSPPTALLRGSFEAVSAGFVAELGRTVAGTKSSRTGDARARGSAAHRADHGKPGTQGRLPCRRRRHRRDGVDPTGWFRRRSIAQRLCRFPGP